jgi:tagatose-1,6-bisphosphate aldolase
MIDPADPSTARAGLEAIARPDGTLAILAMDQRTTLRRMLRVAERPSAPADLSAFKVDVTAALSPLVPAVLLDPDYGVPAVTHARALAPTSALLVAVEPAEQDEWNGEPRVRRDLGRTAAWVREMGGRAVKLLVHLRPDRPRAAGGPDLVTEVLEVVAAVVGDSAAAGVPCVVEALLYPLAGEEPLAARRRAELIAESARLLTQTRPDLLKLEFPADAAGCRAVGAAVTVPWALLSGGMDIDAFLDALALACDEGGASGFVAGRVYWKEAVALAGDERRHFLDTVARARLARSLEVIDGRAVPWEMARQRHAR